MISFLNKIAKRFLDPNEIPFFILILVITFFILQAVGYCITLYSFLVEDLFYSVIGYLLGIGIQIYYEEK